MKTSFQQQAISLLVVLLVISAIGCLSRGLLVFVTAYNGGWDLFTRAAEFKLFSEHVYPNHFIAPNSQSDQKSYSVYPPYAFPMFAPFFAHGSILVASIVFWIASLWALVVIGVFGYREMGSAGSTSAKFGAVAALAIAHNSSALAFGQFSIICMGLVVLQLHYLRRGNALAAGIFWALAMVKPQIGIAFVLPFLRSRRWKGLALGVALLVGLSWFTFIYTNVSPNAFINYWLRQESFEFITGGDSRGSSFGGILAAFGAIPRSTMFICIAVAVAIGAVVWTRARDSRMPDLVLLAIGAIIVRVFVPHRAYDNIMLFPALIALWALALERKSDFSFTMALLFGLSLWIPITSLVRSAWLDALLLLGWFASACFLMLAERRRAPDA